MEPFPHFDENMESLWPLNITLEEARTSVAGRIDFRETIAYDYVSFIYFLGMEPDLFPDPQTAPDELTKRKWQIRRECRGIIFHKDGYILSRRFQKFFNIGELPETNIDRLVIKRPFVLLEKLDGSMIAPFFVEGTLRYCTKSGYTDSSKIVEDFVNSHQDTIPYTKFCTEAINAGFSPIFEWCSPSGRIVLEYQEETLNLLAVRHMITGNYVPFNQLSSIAKSRGIPMVKKWVLQDVGTEIEDATIASPLYHTAAAISSTSNQLTALSDKMDLYGPALHELHSKIATQTGVEGFVLQQSNGVMHKIKTTWYFSFHRATQFMKYYGERHVWEAILKGTIDDVKAWLPASVREAINQFTSELMKRAEACALSTFEFALKSFKDYPERALFAAHVITKEPEASMKSLLWRIFAYLDDSTTKKLTKTVMVQDLTVQTVYGWILEFLRFNSSSPKTLKKNTAFVGNLSYETYRPKNDVSHVFSASTE